MNKLHSSVALAALAAIFMAAPAVAADYEAPPPPPEYSWTGFHIGAGVGGNFAFFDERSDGYIHNHNNINEINGAFFEGDSHSDLGAAGFLGTVEAGFDWQLGSSIVVGALANYDFGDSAKASHDHSGFVNDNNGNIIDDATFKTSWEMGDSWAVGGRLGFLVSESALVYVLGGYTQADIKGKVELSESNNNGFSNSVHVSDSNWEDGWFVGGGIEAMLTDNISIKGEYRYADYGTVKVKSDDFGNFNGNFHEGAEGKADVTVHSVRAVLSFKFNPF